jgi:hypothetical protein
MEKPGESSKTSRIPVPMKAIPAAVVMTVSGTPGIIAAGIFMFRQV